MLTKRIIPCLDVMNGKTVKGINFVEIKEVGDPVALGVLYAEQGADELVFLDIAATNENRKTFTHLVSRIAKYINIPFTVGGGVSSIEDVRNLLNSGADKVSVNTAAVKHPALINQLAAEFGSQCIVVAMDIKLVKKSWKVFLNGGKVETDIDALEWAKEVEQRGAGEILLTSMNNDGTKSGFAISITRDISEAVSIPVIASGGAGLMSHFVDVFIDGKADAALAASIFHYKEIQLQELKMYLRENNIKCRV